MEEEKESIEYFGRERDEEKGKERGSEGGRETYEE